MRDVDLEAMKKVLPDWAKLIGPIESIIMSTPDPTEIKALEALFPKARLHVLDERLWNLDKEYPGQFDLFWCVSVFMCAKDPALWLRNILKSCKNIWMVDHVEAWRCGADGQERAVFDRDVMRYHVPGHRAFFDQAFDLGAHLGDKIVDTHVYPVFGPKGDNRSFLMWIKQ